MLSFEAKATDEQYPFWVDFSRRLAPGESLSSGQVTIRVAPDTDAPDDNPNAMLIDAASVNGGDFQFWTETGAIGTVEAGKGLMITVGGGVDGGVYILRFKANRSGGGTLVQSVKLRVQTDV